MKHMFLPLPIETARTASEEWHPVDQPADAVHLVEVQGGCCVVTREPRPPRLFVELLKGALRRRDPRLTAAG